MAFALINVRETNFTKLVQGFLYHFCTAGPMQDPPKAIRVRLSYPNETKFYIALGFQRTEMHEMSGWTYTRTLD